MNKDSNKNRYILYARKSTESEDRQVASIQSQINEMEKVADMYELKVTKTLSESSSGFKIGREKFSQMLQAIENGEADSILCWKLSRLSRNPDDAGRIMGMLQRGEIKHIRTYSKDWYPEDNVMMMYVEFGITNQFSKDLKDDTARGMRQKAERGWKPTSSLPLGYLHNIGNKKSGLPKDEIINDPNRYELVKHALELIASKTKTPKQALEEVNSLGLRTKKSKKVSLSTFYYMLVNPFFYGQFEYPLKSGNWYDGKHEKMISIQQYQSIKEVLGLKNNPRPQRHSFSYTGLMKCGECGSSITAMNKEKIQKNGKKHNYTYYCCTKKKKTKNGKCSQKYIEIKDLERQFNETIESIYIPKEFAEWAIEELKKEHKKEQETRLISTSINNNNYENCVRKIDRLLESYLSGDIPNDVYKAKMVELEKDKKLAKMMIDHTDESVDDWIKKAEDIFNFAIHAKREFEHGTIEKKREIISKIGLNFILLDKKVFIDMDNPIEKIKEIAPKVNTLIKRFEPLKTVENKKAFREELANDPIWGGLWELNP